MSYALEIAKLANEACGSRDQWDQASEAMHDAAIRADAEIATLRHQLGPGGHIAHKDDWWCGGCGERFVGAADTYASRASCPTCGCWVQSYWELRVEELEAKLSELSQPK